MKTVYQIRAEYSPNDQRIFGLRMVDDFFSSDHCSMDAPDMLPCGSTVNHWCGPIGAFLIYPSFRSRGV